MNQTHTRPKPDTCGDATGSHRTGSTHQARTKHPTTQTKQKTDHPPTVFQQPSYDLSVPVIDPKSLRIVRYPDPALRRRAARVNEPTSPQVRAVAQRMIELMYEAEGIGLAAPQVGLPWSLFVVDVPPTDDDHQQATPAFPGTSVTDRITNTQGPLVYVNPTLADPAGPPEPANEGCLSLPEIRGDVLRPPHITVNATDLEGKPFTTHAAGLLARCIQHEYDHLQGVLILDRFTQMSRLRNRAAIRSLERR